MGTPPWSRVKEVIEAALDRGPDERAQVIREMCGGDFTLQVEVESLLSAMHLAVSFVERPALESLASLDAVAPVQILDAAGRALQTGETIGPYEIVDFIGAGGMGEVYRARDRTLNRDSALKVLPKRFGPDADGLARFRREARVLASLNHSNIAAIYGFEEGDPSTGSGQAVSALALEFVEGPTLADRIATGAIPVDEALSIASQIANGLESAHGRGIVHRDLKPANIKVRPDGTVKILDFGLAKAREPGESPAVTRAGVIVGTAAYMSPEQARGTTVDKRTDIWAFGCVMYEMLTGRRAFAGETAQDTLVAVVVHEPEWSALPAGTPAGIVTLLHRCLEKDPGRRLHDIADARIEIQDATTPSPIVIRRESRWLAVLAVAGVMAIAIVVAGRNSPRFASPREAASDVKRLEIRLPTAGSLARASALPVGVGRPSIAITPDGTRLAYVLEREGVTQLYLRGIDELEATPVQHTEGAFAPFFSPDGRWIGFFSGNKLKKVAVGGGDPIELCDAPNPYGGAWLTDGTILFAPDEGRRPSRVSENGGMPQPIVVKNSAGSFRHPDVLPGGKAAIVTNPLLRNVGVLLLDTGEFRPLVERAGGGQYAPSGHLIFARAGTLLAVPFDVERLAVTGPESVILEGVRMDPAGPIVPQAVFSRDGTLVYASGSTPPNAVRPVWVDRQGSVHPLGMPPRSYRNFSLSPDGRQLAIVIEDGYRDLWVQDLDRGVLTRLTSGAQIGASAWWDDKRIVFDWRTNPTAQVFSVPVDGSGEPEPVTTHRFVPTSLSPDRQLLAGFRQDPSTGQDLYVLALKGNQAPQPFLRTRFTEAGAMFSPDGRWIAYASDESGQYEIYVRPYPGPGGKRQISIDGGEHVVWSRNGKELFYRNGQKWMSVAVNLTGEFTAEKPRLLFEGRYVMIGLQSYDVTSDGQRFLVLEPVEEEPVTHLNVVLNWFEDVKRKTAARPAALR